MPEAWYENGLEKAQVVQTLRFWNVPMIFLAGEEVSEEKKLRCQKCKYEVQVPKGSSVPKCSKCGHDIFESSEPSGNGDG